MEELEKRIIRVEETQRIISGSLEDIKIVMKDIASSLNALAVLEEKHKHTSDTLDRIFNRIDKNSERLDAVEKELPHLKLASSWVFMFTLGVIGSLASLAVGIILWNVTH